MQLHEFFDYKNQLMKDLLTHPKIVRLMDDTLPLERAGELAYTAVFPYEFVPETVEHGKTFVCFDVDVQESLNKTYLLPTLYVWVFTHKSLLRLPEGGVRTDALCSEICEVINGSLMYGLGHLRIYTVKRFAPMTDYQGKCMAFHATDFNSPYNPKLRVPANRKAGD